MNVSGFKRALEHKFGEVTESSGSNGTELIVDCPWCDRHKLSVNPGKGVFHCWHCNEAGTTWKLFGKRVKVDVEEDPYENRRKRLRQSGGYLSPGELVSVGTLPYEHEACVYLRNRGFDPKVVSSVFDLCYCRKGRKYGDGIYDTTGTLIIPVQLNGQLVAWQSRLLYDPSKVKPGEEGAMGWKFDEGKGKYKAPPKYFTMPKFDKGRTFFNFDQASQYGFCVVTEGAFDAMSVGPCAVAAFGKGLTDMQVEILSATWPLVVLLLDPDAEEDQEKLVKRLEGCCKVVPVRLSGYKDAGDAPHIEVVRQIILAATAEHVDLREYSRDDPFKLTRRQQR